MIKALNFAMVQPFCIITLVTLVIDIVSVPCLFARESRGQTDALPPWEPKVLELAATLPIQDGGRIKPLDTFARFKLLKLNGRRICYSPDGKRLTPTEWLLDCLFHPELAIGYKIFLVQNDAVLDAIKVSHEGKKKRDRYAYDELLSGRNRLFDLANEYVKIDEKERDAVQAQIVHLAENLLDFEWIIHYLDFTRETYEIPPASDTISEIFPGCAELRLSDIMKHAKTVRDRFISLQQKESDSVAEKAEQEMKQLTHLLSWTNQIGSRSAAIAIFPPGETELSRKEWLTPEEVMTVSFQDGTAVVRHVELISFLEDLHRVRKLPGQFIETLNVLHAAIKELAESREEYKKIPLEVAFYKGKYFYHALLVYVLSFLLVAISWLKSNSNILNKLIPLSLIVATLLLITGIALRCIIRSRPPVSTLYETILFVTAVSVVLVLVAEYITRRKLGFALGAVIGALGLFLANKYEIKEGTDTMTSLIAVLDSNYWLSTHVTTVTIGYAAGLLACVVAHIYIIGRAVGARKDDREFYRGVSRMVYGIICFGLLFSVIGTILGGIWANDSWGRFWGWDPKENGALMIILGELAILHARMGRYIRELGICMSAIAIGGIVAFSWWGVNLLGVGLHSYGWTSGVFNALIIYYGLELTVLLIGGIVWYRDRRFTTAAA